MLLWALAGLALAAQEPPAWTAAPPPRTPESMITTMERYRFMVDCEMGQNWTYIHALFDTRIGSPEEQAILRRISGQGGRITGGDRGNDCTIADQMRLTSMLLRGGIAESRYRHIYARGSVPPANTDIAPVADGAMFVWVGFNRDSHPQLLYDLATCLAERETGAVHAVLMTRYASREEREAMQALSRRFGTCIPAGREVRANPLTLRPWLAEAQYQYFRARQPDAAN
ncbi:MAG TPA: hypothetical protein VIT38_02960 [Allosphingosinicella sp.]